MASISYLLNNARTITDNSKPQVIYIRVRHGRNVEFRASLGISVYSKDWNSKKQRIKNRSHLTNNEEINNLLTNLESYFQDKVIDYKRKGIELSKQTAKQIFTDFFETKAEDDSLNLFAFIDKFISDSKTQPNHQTGKPVSKQTITSYEVTKNFLKRFNNEVYKVNFETITLDFYYDFIEFGETNKLSKNYIGKHIKTLKTFMSEATEKGYSDNYQFKSKKFVVLREEAENIYLTNDELLSIWNLDLSQFEKLNQARDLFLIGAYTGLRVSDYNNLNKQNIKTVKGVEMLYVKTKKTGKIVAIPLHPIVKNILNKYDGNTPSQMPDQQINYKIKDVGESAGIDSVEHITQTKGGKQITVKKMKYELIKTHTARRSFCTNAYLSGMNAIDIMAISGHTTEKAFLKYIKVTPEQTAIRMADHPFFKDAKTLKIVS